MSTIHEIRPKQGPRENDYILRCTKCGIAQEATCNCGADYKAISKIEAAKKAILDDPTLSDAAIAEKIGVGRMTVARAREVIAEQGAQNGQPVQDQQRKGRDGKVYTMPTPEELAERERKRQAEQAERIRKIQEETARQRAQYEQFKADGGFGESTEDLLGRLFQRSNSDKPPLTMDEYKLIAKCLHPDFTPDNEIKTQAMTIWNVRKFQLTGIK